MIAPQRTDSAATVSHAELRRARRAIAGALLPAESDVSDPGPPVPFWHAWLVTGWMMITTCYYFWTLARRFL